MSSFTLIIATILEYGLYFGPIFLLSAGWLAIDPKTAINWRHPLAFGAVLTATGWLAMDVNRSVRCDDWETLGYLDEEGCKSMYFESRSPD